MKKGLLLFSILILSGCGNQEEDINGMKIEYEKLNAEIQEKKTELALVEAELNSLNMELEESQEESEVIELPTEPKEVSAGEYTFGEEIETGRFKILAQEGHKGPVYVEDLDDRLKVSKTFGIVDGKEVDYVFDATDGDRLKATIPILLFPVE